nr:MAG TPA: DNA polymerase [Caudoviricetes sp.]
MSYRNIYYNSRAKKMTLFTWDKDGNPIREEYDYKPWLYVGTTGSKDAVSMFNTSLKKLTFNTDFERRKYVADSGITKFFDNLPCIQQFLVEKFWNVNETPEFSQIPLKVAFIDIEVYSPGEFPEPREAKAPINAITLYDTYTKIYNIWGTKPYTVKQSDMVYHYFADEKEMMKDFIQFFELADIDVFSGFNSESFDIPYIMNRINNILDSDWAKRMSPVGEVYSSDYVNRFGALTQKWKIQGISCIDYLEIYRKLIAKELPSFKLNYIAELELGEHKLEYEQSNLFDLADKDWERFIDYNIQDVVLLVKLDQKLKYLHILRLLAYAGLTDMESAMGTTAVTLGGMAIRCKYRDKKIMTFKREGKGTYAGAFVIDPIKGFHSAIASFDANSLYPNTCITCNISPETKLGYIISDDDSDIVEFQNVSGKLYKIDKEKFYKLCKQEKMAVAANKIVYNQKIKGVLPEYMDYYYQARVKVKKVIKDLKKKYEEEQDPQKKHDLKFELDRLDMVQYSYKIQINSAYGALGAAFFPAGDTDVAASITATGKATVKKSYEIAKQFAVEQGVPRSVAESVPRAGDTDSGYLSFQEIFDAQGINLTESDGVTITKQAYDKVAEYGEYLNSHIKQWAQDVLYSVDPRLKFSREVIADKAMFLRKKRYMIHVLDNEGNTHPKFKCAGLEIKRTNMPADVKVYATKLLENMCVTRDINSTNDILVETYDYIKTLNEEQVAEVSNINGYEKYSSQCSGLQTVKGMPRHVKSAYLYNYLIKQLGLTSKYQQIKDGDKIRVLAVDPKQNKYKISAIAFIGKYPQEFKDIFKIDYEYMFDKHIYGFVERYYEDCGWVARKPGCMIKQSLFDLFN